MLGRVLASNDFGCRNCYVLKRASSSLLEKKAARVKRRKEKEKLHLEKLEVRSASRSLPDFNVHCVRSGPVYITFTFLYSVQFLSYNINESYRNGFLKSKSSQEIFQN